MKRIHYGEYLIETDGEWARVFDKVSHRRLFEGELDRVMRELTEKIEGNGLDRMMRSIMRDMKKFDLMLDRKKKRGWL